MSVLSKKQMGSMKRNCILLFCMVFLGFPLYSRQEPILARDIFIGQIIEVQMQSVEALAKQALLEPYSLSWIESYIPASMRTGFVHTYDRLLASMLPLGQVQVAEAVRRGRMIEVPFCYHEPAYGYGSMTWMQNEDGRFVLLSLSVQQ